MTSPEMNRNVLAAVAVAVIAGLAAGVVIGRQSAPKPAPKSEPAAFVPPPESAIPDDQLGEQIRLGQRIFTDTGHEVPRLVGNDLKCSNCHLDEGRRANAAPLWAAYGLYPQYRKKNGHVNNFGERIRECFRYSMNGVQPAADDPAVLAIEAYASFLARGAPHGVTLPGQGYAQLPPPAQPADHARGAAIYKAHCALCHGPDGQGQHVEDVTTIPPLWGPRAFNWGAGMAQVPNAAAFIKSNMPQDKPGSLSVQDAWDVAAFVDGKPRPQDPRWLGSVQATAEKFHDPKRSQYGMTVDGVRLGDDGPPKPFRPAVKVAPRPL